MAHFIDNSISLLCSRSKKNSPKPPNLKGSSKEKLHGLLLSKAYHSVPPLNMHCDTASSRAIVLKYRPFTPENSPAAGKSEWTHSF